MVRYYFWVAAFLGVINLLQLHLNKVAVKENIINIVQLLLGFVIMIIFGFIYRI